MDKDHKRKCFTYTWRIENFNLCWHGTGEFLQSPLFQTLPETFWRIWLYPRGEDDGEYISCFLFRALGGPEVVNVDFELSIFVGELLLMPPVRFDKIHTIESCQKSGRRYFARRRNILSRPPAQKNTFTLTLVCRIFYCDGDLLRDTEEFGRTIIAMDRISKMSIFEDGVNLDDHCIEVKSIFEDDPLISIDLSHTGESIVIKVHPAECKKIKYATCKITIVKNWDRESPIKYFRSWIGEIETDICRYHMPLPQKAADSEAKGKRTFFLHYDFAYSIGIECTNSEFNDYGTELWMDDISLLEEESSENVQTKETLGYLTAEEVLKREYGAKTYADVTIKTQTTTFEANKAVLRSRSPILKSILTKNKESLDIKNFPDGVVRRFLFFLYTDTVEELYWPVAIELYKMADYFKVGLLKNKVGSFLENNLGTETVSELLLLAESLQDLPLKELILKYIVYRDEEVFSTVGWKMLAENHKKLAEEYMFWKYENKI